METRLQGTHSLAVHAFTQTSHCDISVTRALISQHSVLDRRVNMTANVYVSARPNFLDIRYGI